MPREHSGVIHEASREPDAASKKPGAASKKTDAASEGPGAASKTDRNVRLMYNGSGNAAEESSGAKD